MHTQSTSRQRDSIRTHARTITFYTLLSFSLAGLLAGFAIGGFAQHLSHNSSGTASLPISSAPMLTGHSPSPSATVAPENNSLGVPSVALGDYTSSEMADGTTSYQFSVQITDKTGNTPNTTSNIVCRLWLTNDPQATMDGLSADNYAIPRNPSAFNQPFPQEITGALNFASASPQTQPCTVNGKTRWTYTLAPALPHGTYYLAVLADWQGIHYNWYLVAIATHDANG